MTVRENGRIDPLGALTRPSGVRRQSLVRGLVYALVLAAVAGAWRGAEMDPLQLVRDFGNIVKEVREFFPPDFTEWREYVREMWVTIAIAVWGTVLAVVFAIPFGLLCANNIAPWWIAQPCRRVMDLCRCINELVFAMLFVAAVGLGPFAGVLALFVHTTGILAKLFAEAVEAIDPHPVEGIRATGANLLEEIVYGVIPQVMPLWISYALYRFESNVRSASVVGLVGAGGIGLTIWEVVRAFQFPQACAVIAIIFAAVIIIDAASQWLRRMFV
jgi:phosphonate transport system permease protein